ncbi:hypothetical protein [Chamaesiphon sp.]|uniref:hypothetical protein n=1 Tax=Chamaesiphon sp. TaxID=2814140 RepID=UPI0035943CAF
MTKSSPQKSDRRNWLSGEYVIYWALIWATIAALLYLNFSVVDPQATRPVWFKVATTGLEEVGLIVAGCLCLRNWRSAYIAGGRAVWLLFAIAMFAFFVGNLWFCLWEMWWGLEPAASIGNLFFALFYLMLIAGMRLAILDRDVRLAIGQWVLVAGVAMLGLTMGCWLTTLPARAILPAPAATIAASHQTISIATAPTIPLQLMSLNTIPSPNRAPDWVLAIDRSMQPLVSTFNSFYVLCDLVLLTFATILFLGFWGGRLGLPWRMTAQAVLCFYIADTWFAYAHNQVQGYESGFIMEVFWIFGIVQFGVAAALEFDNSIRARRLARRRTAIK